MHARIEPLSSLGNSKMFILDSAAVNEQASRVINLYSDSDFANVLVCLFISPCPKDSEFNHIFFFF